MLILSSPRGLLGGRLSRFFQRVGRYPSRSNLQRNVECHVRSCSESRERASCFQLYPCSETVQLRIIDLQHSLLVR